MFALTPRLTLRPGWPEDAPALAAAMGHEAVVMNLARAPWPYRQDDAEAYLSLPQDAHEPRFMICERGRDDRVIGGIGLIAGGTTPELGYWLTPSAWGRGYATEAGRAVIAIARDTLRFRSLAARHHAANPASGRVLAKLGFRETGRARTYSLARDAEVESVEHALDLSVPRRAGPTLAIAA